MSLPGRPKGEYRGAQHEGRPVSDWRRAGLPRVGAVVVSASVLLLGTLPAHAADDDAARTQVDQKIRLVSTLISDSPTAQRIASSGNPQAAGHLNEGRVHLALAQELRAGGDLAGARRAADDALRHVGMARRLVPDAPARQAAARQRHEQLLASVERLIEAWRARATTQAPDDGNDLIAAIGLVGMSRLHAQEGRFDEANQVLVQAERHVLAGMNRRLHATTLDYTLRSATPTEEFAHELARHRGFAELLPLALRELKPRPDALALIERYADTSTTLQAQAQKQFQAGDATQALAQIRNATLYVQRALLAAGLVTPQPNESPP
jgi:tetratricopeptide (TPR) repeat protein